MNSLRQYQNRFNQLIESKSGNVKPLIMEQAKEIKVGSQYQFDNPSDGETKTCQVTKIYPNDIYWIIQGRTLDGERGCHLSGGRVEKKDGTEERYMALHKHDLSLAADFVLRETDNPPKVKEIGGGYGSNMITWL